MSFSYSACNAIANIRGLQGIANDDRHSEADILARGIHRLPAESYLQSMMRVLVESALELVSGDAGTWCIGIGDEMVFTNYRLPDAFITVNSFAISHR